MREHFVKKKERERHYGNELVKTTVSKKEVKLFL